MNDLPAGRDTLGGGDPLQLSASGSDASASLGVVGSPEESLSLFHLNIADRSGVVKGRMRRQIAVGGESWAVGVDRRTH